MGELRESVAAGTDVRSLPPLNNIATTSKRTDAARAGSNEVPMSLTRECRLREALDTSWRASGRGDVMLIPADSGDVAAPRAAQIEPLCARQRVIRRMASQRLSVAGHPRATRYSRVGATFGGL